METKTELSKLIIEGETARAKVTERNRGRMKLQLKFSQEQSEALKNFYLAAKGIDESKFKLEEYTEFLKSMVFFGVHTAQNQLLQNLKNEVAKNPEMLKKLEEDGLSLEDLLNEDASPTNPEPEKEVSEAPVSL